MFELSRSCYGIVEVSNKESRIESISALIREVLEDKELSTALAAVVRGKLQHAEGQVFNRIAAVMMPDVRARAGGSLAGS